MVLFLRLCTPLTLITPLPSVFRGFLILPLICTFPPLRGMVYQLVGRSRRTRGRTYLNCTATHEDAREATLLGVQELRWREAGARSLPTSNVDYPAGYHGGGRWVSDWVKPVLYRLTTLN